MISAFGVDHGEISKRGGPAAPKKVLGLWRRAPRGPNNKKLNPQQIRSQQGTPKPGPAAQAKAKAHAVGEADISPKAIGRGVGAGVSGFGRFVEEHPGTAGVTALGAGGAGIYGVARGAEARRRTKKS